MTDEARVTALLDAAGLDPPDDERAAFVAIYPMLRSMVESLYAVPEAREEVPALVFDPMAPSEESPS